MAGELLPEREGLTASLFRDILQEEGMAMINTFQGGEATFARTRRTQTRLDHIAASADLLARLRLRRVLVRTGIWLQLTRSTQRHDHSPVFAVFQRNQVKEQTRDEPAWSAEAINACWMNGWKRPEVIGALEAADAINDFFIQTVTKAVQPLLAKRPKDEEE